MDYTLFYLTEHVPIVFRADALGILFACLFAFTPNSLTPVITFMTNQYWFCILIGILFSMPIMPKVKSLMEKYKLGIVADIAVVITFIFAIAFLLGSGFSPFLYFRF